MFLRKFLKSKHQTNSIRSVGKKEKALLGKTVVTRLKEKNKLSPFPLLFVAMMLLVWVGSAVAQTPDSTELNLLKELLVSSL